MTTETTTNEQTNRLTNYANYAAEFFTTTKELTQTAIDVVTVGIFGYAFIVTMELAGAFNAVDEATAHFDDGNYGRAILESAIAYWKMYSTVFWIAMAGSSVNNVIEAATKGYTTRAAFAKGVALSTLPLLLLFGLGLATYAAYTLDYEDVEEFFTDEDVDIEIDDLEATTE